MVFLTSKPLTFALFLFSALVPIAARSIQARSVCAKDDDCASGCCGFSTGKCIVSTIALEQHGGCGFGEAQPRIPVHIVARDSPPPASTTTAQPAPPQTTTTVPPPPSDTAGLAPEETMAKSTTTMNPPPASTTIDQAPSPESTTTDQPPAPSSTIMDPPPPSPPKTTASQSMHPVSTATSPPVASGAMGPNGPGNGAGKQYITGECYTDADCASGCCGRNTGKCNGNIVAYETDGGCGHMRKARMVPYRSVPMRHADTRYI